MPACVRTAVDLRFPAELARLRRERGLSLRALAGKLYQSKTLLHELETGRARPTVEIAARLDEALDAGGRLSGMVRRLTAQVPEAAPGNELKAWELARRVEASDVGTETVERLERAVDELAGAYPTTRPAELLTAVRAYLAYLPRLLDGRATLTTRRRLIVAGGWLALLRATVHIDLRQLAAAEAYLQTADQLGGHAEHLEIRAWCRETRAWQAVTCGDYRTALGLAQQAQAIAPRGSSARIQSVAQEGRVWARIGDVRRTRRALAELDRLTGPLPVPDRPEHHYRYDPSKAAAYTATTLAWAGDPAAEEHARAVLAELDPAGDGGARPRRVASARLDLGLALVAADEPEEAAAQAEVAIVSGRVVPSNWWRATELMAAVERSGVRRALDLREAYETYRPVGVA
ncbi:helix-turn-helix domain-containing protein [Micromonospora zhanjiangensis]|uniref:Helix-turn-helix domain-containing protein n=1 Tax=Micromonospora zhanjiangensis TaxID=1522057 RepID=A0ABV8KYA7_9ACTN